MLLHSIALRPQPVSDLPVTASSTQLEALLSALEAGKRFLDGFLSFPAHEYNLFSFSEWMRLASVIMTVARLCMPTDAHIAASWDVTTAQERVRLELCLESLCYRMQSLSTYDKRSQPHVDFWHAMRFIIDLTRTWYIRKIRPKLPVDTSSQPTPSGTEGFPASEKSGPSSGTQSTPSTHQSGQPYTTLAGINHTADISLDVGVNVEEGNEDPFAFLKDVDLDMEQFFDIGLWGDESYVGMGFGGGSMPF